jgi:hypothetical protein
MLFSDKIVFMSRVIDSTFAVASEEEEEEEDEATAISNARESFRSWTLWSTFSSCSCSFAVISSADASVSMSSFVAFVMTWFLFRSVRVRFVLSRRTGSLLRRQKGRFSLKP